MKKSFLKTIVLLLLLGLGAAARAQVYVASGTGFFMATGGIVSTSADVESHSDLTGPGALYLNSISTAQNFNMSGFMVSNLVVDNTSGVALTGNATVGTLLTFNNGAVTLSNNSLTFAAGAGHTGAASGKLLVTNGTGVAAAASVTAGGSFTFPVGISSSSYTPLAVTNGGTAQTINVAVKNYSGSSANEGTAPFGVDRSWLLYSSAGGAVSTLALTHDPATNQTNYYAGGAYITRQQNSTSGTWTNPNSSSYGGVVSPAGESGTPATLTSAGNTYYTNNLVLGSTATTASADNAWYSKSSRATGLNGPIGGISLSLTVLLQGAYSGGTMTNTLQTVGGTGVLPTNSQTAYSLLPRVDYSSVNSTGGAAGTVTDWVDVELRDATTPSTVVERQSFLVKPNGQVVNEAGSTTLPFASAPGNYYIAVSHRNHLGVRSAITQTFTAGGTVTYDFTTAQAQAYQNPAITTNAAMAALSGGKFGLWAGNANGNTTVRYGGPANDETTLLTGCLGSNTSTVLSNVYSGCDLNLNGIVRYGGPANDETILLTTVLGGNTALVLSQHQ